MNVSPVEAVIFAGLVNWLATWIVVEGVVFDGPRDWFVRHAPGKWGELVQCHLCAGTWLALLMALVIPGPFALFFLNAFLYKAVGHLTLEVATILRYVVARLKPRARDRNADRRTYDDLGPLANLRMG